MTAFRKTLKISFAIQDTFQAEFSVSTQPGLLEKPLGSMPFIVPQVCQDEAYRENKPAGRLTT